MAKNIYVPVFRINVLYMKQFVEITVLKDISIKEHLSFNNEQRKNKINNGFVSFKIDLMLDKKSMRQCKTQKKQRCPEQININC